MLRCQQEQHLTCVLAATYHLNSAVGLAVQASAGVLVFAAACPLNSALLLKARRFISHPHHFEHNLEDCDGARACAATVHVRGDVQLPVFAAVTFRDRVFTLL